MPGRRATVEEPDRPAARPWPHQPIKIRSGLADSTKIDGGCRLMRTGSGSGSMKPASSVGCHAAPDTLANTATASLDPVSLLAARAHSTSCCFDHLLDVVELLAGSSYDAPRPPCSLGLVDLEPPVEANNLWLTVCN